MKSLYSHTFCYQTFEGPKIHPGIICLQVKGYRYLEEDNSDESESEEEEEEDDKDEEEHGEHGEDTELAEGEGPRAGEEGGQEVDPDQDADSQAPPVGAAEVHRHRRWVGEDGGGKLREEP